MAADEYLAESESPGGESGLHRRSPGLTPELQSAVPADEVVRSRTIFVSVGYGYQTLPTARFPTLPDRDYLEII